MHSKVPVDDQLVALSQRLDRAQISHGFGGWIAHGYYTACGASSHFSMRVFGTPHEEVRLHLDRLGIEVLSKPNPLRYWEPPLLVACGDGPEDRAAARRIVRVPFGEDTIPILSAEDLVVDELHYEKPDWSGLERLVFCRLGELDTDYLLWALAGLADDDRRKRKLRTIVRAFAGLELDDLGVRYPERVTPAGGTAQL